jgi:Spy/CpxP family protein refolding chaperone
MKKCLAVLTIIGFLFLTVAAYAQQPPAKPEKPAKPEPGPRGPLANLKDFLKLTPEQEAKLKDMQKARQDEQKAFRDEMQKLRGELNPLLKDPKADQNKINSLVDQIAKLGADRTKKVLANRNPLQKILTPEQLEKLKNAPARMMGGRGMGPGMQGMRQGMGQGMGPGMGRGMGQGMGRMGQGRMMQPGFRQGLGLGLRLGLTRPGLGRMFGFMGAQGMRGGAMRGPGFRRGLMNRRGLGRWFRWQE